MKRISVFCLVFGCFMVLSAGVRGESPSIPIVYSTDLFHPHQDPDDHYDLACLLAIKEFQVEGIILDNHSMTPGKTQSTECGKPAVEQMLEITGRKIPYAIGLSSRLRTLQDKALAGPSECQGGVELLLSALRRSSDRVVIMSAGSCCDVAAAFNREPKLFRQKVRAIYINAGSGPGRAKGEYNVASIRRPMPGC